ncbi:hypothetical protein [Bacillus sp. KH172YL63]|uniref:hypothetical protein n=1 Tax=Bacillus sp. KH172YL63 TaxID=2709784 RepID=UPI0013E46179|nr:hypothetical protein [Bacillus sp. KH172YL63]BCB05883.1 hypothetical protein KH172YL63_40160 [Bacillus sp. KH172YL63]
MVQALIGMVFAWLFLIISAVVVFKLPSLLHIKSTTFEKKLTVEAVIWIGCASLILLINPVYVLVKTFALAVIFLNISKLIAVPMLVRFKQTNRRKYLILKRFIRKFW